MSTLLGVGTGTIVHPRPAFGSGIEPMTVAPVQVMEYSDALQALWQLAESQI
jgi:hypothetical protein